MNYNLVAQIILFCSSVGLAQMIYRKMPILSGLSEAMEVKEEDKILSKLKEGIKEKKRKRLIMDRPDLFPELFGLVREKTVSRPASKITIEQKEFGPIQKLKSTVVGKPEKVFMFTDTGLLTVPQVKHPSKRNKQDKTLKKGNWF